MNEPAPLSRLGIFGDIHGEAQRLASVLAFLHRLPLDALFCTGDLPAKGYALGTDPARQINDCAALLRGANVFTVRGNHDRYLCENATDPTLAELFRAEWETLRDALAFVRTLPATRRFSTVRGDLLLCHGVGTDDAAGIYPGGNDAPVADALQKIGEPVRFLVAGHTHRRMVRNVGEVTILNPGALAGDKEPPGFAVADFDAEAVMFYTVAAGGAIHKSSTVSWSNL